MGGLRRGACCLFLQSASGEDGDVTATYRLAASDTFPQILFCPPDVKYTEASFSSTGLLGTGTV